MTSLELHREYLDSGRTGIAQCLCGGDYGTRGAIANWRGPVDAALSTSHASRKHRRNTTSAR